MLHLENSPQTWILLYWVNLKDDNITHINNSSKSDNQEKKIWRNYIFLRQGWWWSAWLVAVKHMKRKSVTAAYIFLVQRESRNQVRDGRQQPKAHLLLSGVTSTFIALQTRAVLRKKTQDNSPLDFKHQAVKTYQTLYQLVVTQYKDFS